MIKMDYKVLLRQLEIYFDELKNDELSLRDMDFIQDEIFNILEDLKALRYKIINDRLFSSFEEDGTNS